MKKLTVPMEIKAVSDKGAFEGYAAVFDNVDFGYDIIEKGAFQEIVKGKDGRVKTLFQHDSYGYTQSAGLPIGSSEVGQDEHGLWFKGQLVMEDPFVQRVHVHMKAGTLDGMSIGYDVLPGGSEFMESGVRRLKALKLWEISPVTFGMNPKAGIDSVKSARQITSVREFEDFLRDAGGFSKAQAKLLASGGYPALQSRRDDGDQGGVVQQLLKTIESLPLPKF